jgi:transposase
MADIANATPAFNLVAIDIARYWNYVLIETAAGNRHRFKMANTAADFDRLISFLLSLQGPCRVGLEPTGDYHRPIAHRLLMAGVEVVGINSVAVARYRDAMFNSWDKNDPKDAAVILEMLKRHAVQRYVDPMLAGTHDLQELAKTYYQVSRARTKAQHSLVNHGLPLYFPEMHRYWATTRNEWFVRFLLEFPTPAHVRSLSKEAFVLAAWDLVGRKVNKSAKLEEIWETAGASAALPHAPDSLAVEMFRVTLKRYPHLLRRLLRHTDVPTPHLVRARGTMAGHNAAGRFFRPAPVMLLRRRLQHAVKTRFRSDEHAPVGQCWHDLAGRQAGKFLAISNGQNSLTLIFTQPVGRFGPHTGRTAVGAYCIVAILYPALESAQADFQLGTSRFKTTSSSYRFSNQLNT